MMAKVTFVLGLAGSGKSHYAEELKMKTGAEIFEGTEGEEKQEKLTHMVQRLREGKNCIVEEIAYCRPEKREEVKKYLISMIPGTEIKWFCFENDVESANWNVRHRTNKGDIEGHIYINQHYHSKYVYPDGEDLIPITRIGE